MNSAQIDAFLNSKTYSCISPNSGFEAKIPSGYSPSGGFTYGSFGTAGQVIVAAAQAYDLNPQVLIVTLEKEQSLVTGRNSSTYCYGTEHKYAAATGYGCPDSGGSYHWTGISLYRRNGVEHTDTGNTCVNSSSKAGFAQQLIRSAWLLKFSKERSLGHTDWAIIRGSWDNSDDLQSCYSGFMTEGWRRTCPNGTLNYYDGWATIDSSPVKMETGGTASLYRYTPHFNGNRNFFNLYSNWFGVPYANANDYSFVTSSATTLNYNPGGEGSVTIILKNTGYNTWYSDNNLPADKQPTRLATIGYQDSPFADTSDSAWLGTRNQVRMTPDVVAPGEDATFTFDVAAPYQVLSWHHRFVPIIGGLFMKDVGMDVILTSHTPGWTPTTTDIDRRDFLPNQQAHAHITVQNSSASTWYSDNNLPTGKRPTRLATVDYQNTPFADTSDPAWMGTRNQIKMIPDEVAPGQTATFDAWFVAPISSTAVTSNFHFIVVVGGVFTPDKGQVFRLTTPAAVLSFEGVGSTNPPATMSPGQIATVSFSAKNTGNVVWHDEAFQSGKYSMRLLMTSPVYRNSPFFDNTDSRWLAASQIEKPAGTTMPGDTAVFAFNWKAPAQTGFYQEAFQFAVRGVFLPFGGHHFDTTVQ
jgi:hypothetical protein